MEVYVIYGPPCSGKSYYVNEQVTDNSIVFDYDKVMEAISLRESHSHNKHLMGYVLDIRDLIIHRLKFESNLDKAFIITTKLTDGLKKQLIGLNPVYIEIKTSKQECIKRLERDPKGRDKNLWYKLIDQYYNQEEDFKKFYGSPEWKRKRKVIESRDKGLCKECMRYGKRVDGELVHHVIPLKERPDLKLVNENLIYLCYKCHEKAHIRDSDKLSNLGLDIKARILNKYPKLKL